MRQEGKRSATDKAACPPQTEPGTAREKISDSAATCPVPLCTPPQAQEDMHVICHNHLIRNGYRRADFSLGFYSLFTKVLSPNMTGFIVGIIRASRLPAVAYFPPRYHEYHPKWHNTPVHPTVHWYENEF